MPPVPIRLSFQPLHDWIATYVGDPACSVRLVARTCQIRTATMFSWHKHGVPLLAADRLACQLGVHPTEIWGNEFFVGT